MAKFPGNSGGGLNKASSWTDAVANATKYIIINLAFTASIATIPIEINFTIPKDRITSSEKASFQGYYYSASSSGLFQIKYSSSAISVHLYVNGTAISTHTDTFYYE